MNEQPEPRDLPESVRRIVDEIENEIGDEHTPALAMTRGAAPGSSGGIESAVRQILLEIGEDPTREGLAATPDRMHRCTTS